MRACACPVCARERWPSPLRSSAATRRSFSADSGGGGADGSTGALEAAADAAYAAPTSLAVSFAAPPAGADDPASAVLHVELNRPDAMNAMNRAFWAEVPRVFDAASSDPRVRAIVLSARGRHFTAGLDLADHVDLLQPKEATDPSRRAWELRRLIAAYQDSFSAIERCFKPVVAAVHSACIGGGLDMISACDIRYASSDAFFSIKEVDLGLAADVGTLQRMPKVLGNDSLLRELAYTGRNMPSHEALACGFVSKVLDSGDEARAAALATATEIASKSPVAVVGTKHVLNYSRDHPTAQSLEYQVVWNSVMLQSEDILASAQAAMTKQKATYKPL